MSKLRLYYLGQPGDGFGWGVANTNLVAALQKYCDVIVDTSKRDTFDAPVFVPIADSSLNPLRKIRKAPKVLGYCFTEWPIADEAKRNARQYDVIFAGSTWNVQRLAASGIASRDLIQGVDFERFTPRPISKRNKFVVFSGGKFEFRKGQDYVIAAMKMFMRNHTDVVLVTSWHNQWTQSVQTMRKSWLVGDDPMDGLPLEMVISLPPMPNEKLADIYAMSHIGLFPNRCEAGTNMVLTEYMACARPVIATDAHGHKDVLCPASFKLSTGDYDPAGWFNPPVSDIITHLEYAYHNRAELEWRGNMHRAAIEHLTWDRCARIIKDAL
jgi:glycosyltransferase involved in cell wall biosynthesis